MIRFLLFLKRRAWPIAFSILLCGAVLLGTLFYWFPFQGAKAHSVMMEHKVSKLKEERESLQKFYETLKQKFQELEADRDNVLVQTRQLLGEREKYEQSVVELNAVKEKQKTLTETNAVVTEKMTAAETKVAELQSSYDAARAEAESSKAKLERTTRENVELATRSQNTEAVINQYKQKAEENEKYSPLFNSLSVEHEVLKEKYKALEARLGDIPGQFSEMAKENQVLIHETADMHYNLGVFYAKERNYERALKEFQKAVDIDPGDAKAHYNLGYIYADHMQDRARAELHFKTFLELAPDDPNSDAVRNYIISRDVFSAKVLKS
ncbi:MAG: tetratricopeptide repeat protein [Candidatus Omnitrophota bacterium]|jgi:tetratricopeptide (TPR) repeat protein